MTKMMLYNSCNKNNYAIICKNIENSLKSLKISFPSDGHDIYHLRRVCDYSLNIAKHTRRRDKIRIPLLITGAYLHDLHRVNRDCEWVKSIAWTISKEYNIPFEELMFILYHHDDSELYQDSCIEFKIIQDADKLDRIGINGIVRAIRFGACVGEIYYDENNSNNTLNHLTDLVSMWTISKKHFNTMQAYKMSKKLKRYTVGFIKKSKMEWL